MKSFKPNLFRPRNLIGARYASSAFWLLLERVIRLGVGFAVGIAVIRHLGPENFGIIAFVLSFYAILQPLTDLGLNSLITREFARDNIGASRIASTALTMKLIGGAGLVLVTVTYFLFIRDDSGYLLLACLAASTAFFKPMEVLEAYIRSQARPKAGVAANVVGILISAAFKLCGIFLNAGLWLFVVAGAIDAMCVALILYAFIGRRSQLIALRAIDWQLGGQLLRESFPLLFCGIFSVMYLNLDSIMIEWLLGPRDVGHYGAAVRLSTALYFIPMTISIALQPALVRAREAGAEVYSLRLRQVMSLMAITGYAIVVPFSLFAPWTILVCFGAAYEPAGSVLAIHSLACFFLFIGLIRDMCMINESSTSFLMWNSLIAGIGNLALNALLIPRMGIEGAAWATLITFVLGNLLFGAVYPRTRRIFVLQLRCIMLLDVRLIAGLLVQRKSASSTDES